MAEMCVLGRSGHDTVEWKKEDQVSVRRASRRFAELQGAGFKMFRGEASDEDGELLTAFDPEVETIIAVPRMQGG
jgi:hypothetical protein